MKSSLREQLGLLKDLVRYALRTRYQRSALGVAWLFVRPIFLLLVYGVVFSHLAGFRSGRFGAQGSYALYLATGLLPWLVLQEALLGSCRSLRENRQFITRLPTAPELFVLQKVIVSQLTLVIYLAVLWPAMLYMQGPSLILPACMPLLIALHVAFTFGLALVLAWADLVLSDVSHATGYVLTGWFWLTPIVYPASMLTGRAPALLALNPVAALIRVFRAPTLHGTWPAATDLFVTGLFSLCTIAVGLALFSRVRTEVADLV